jgi:hypothetical protein
MSTGLSPAYQGQIQVAADSANAPGTFAALADGSKATIGRKVGQNEFSVLGSGPYAKRQGGLKDYDAKLDHFFDSGDVALATLLAAPWIPARVWARFFSDSTHYLQLAAYLESMSWDSDPSGLTKVSTSLLLDGTPANAYLRSTGSLLTPAAAPSPASGYGAKVSINTVGTTTAMVDEACALVSGKTFRISNAAKRLLDPAAAVVVKDATVAVAAANIASVDMLFGTVTFVSSYTPSGGGNAITISASYLPVSQLVQFKKATSNMKFNLYDSTYIGGGGLTMRKPTTMDFSASLSVMNLATDMPQGTGGDIGATSWDDLLNGRTAVVLQHDPDGTGAKVLRAWVNLESESEALGFSDLVTQDFSATLNSKSNGIYAAGFSLGAP